MTEHPPPMPEAARATYANAIASAARKVHANWRYRQDGIWNLADLRQEAWVIAAERWPAWKNAGHCRTDVFMRLSNRVRELARLQEGLHPDRPDRPRNWVSTSRPWRPEWFTDADTSPWAEPVHGYRAYEGLNVGTRCGRDWQWAQTFSRSYPRAAEEFVTAYEHQKPATQSQPEYELRREKRRARLLAKYAAEIASIDNIEGIAA